MWDESRGDIANASLSAIFGDKADFHKKLQDIVNRMFDRCFQDGEYN
jgi:hypothetical protein